MEIQAGFLHYKEKTKSCCKLPVALSPQLLPVAFSKEQQGKLQTDCTDLYCILCIYGGKSKLKQKSVSSDKTMTLQTEFYKMWQYWNVLWEAAH